MNNKIIAKFPINEMQDSKVIIVNGELQTVLDVCVLNTETYVIAEIVPTNMSLAHVIYEVRINETVPSNSMFLKTLKNETTNEVISYYIDNTLYCSFDV